MRTQRSVPGGVRIVEDINLSRVFSLLETDDLDSLGFQLADQIVNVLRCAAANLAVCIHVSRI